MPTERQAGVAPAGRARETPASPTRRLLLVTNRPLQYAGPGTVRWTSLMAALPRHGWEVSVVSGRANPTQDELSADPRAAALARTRAAVMRQVGRGLRRTFNRVGVQPEAFPPHTLWSVTGRGAIRRRLDEIRPDAVVATVPPMSALFAAAAVCADRDVPLVADMRDNWAGHPSYDAGGDVLRRLEDRALGRVDAIVAVTAGMVEKLGRLHPRVRERIRLLPNGFEPSLLDRRPDASAQWPERITLIHPGVLYGDRGVDALLAALGRPALRGRVRLELVGNVTAATAAALHAAPAGVEVVTTPPQTWEGTMRRVEAADVVAVIVPESMGDDVAWPVKLFEGLALGKPILSITTGGATEALLRDLGQDHALARDGDADSIARALEGLLAAPPPPPVEAERIARFDRTRVAAEYAGLLDELVGAGVSRS